MPSEGRLLEKTPANAVRIPFIDRLFPGCCFVHLLRDGRATTASLMARRVALPFAPRQWVGAHRTALADLAALPPERLVRQPVPVLREICDHCGLTWDRQVEATLVRASAAQVRPVTDRWALLTPFRKRYILSVIGPLQEELSYPL
jgi:hypothetical protein